MLFPTSGRVYVWTSPKEAYNPECLVVTVQYGARSDDLGSNIYYSAGPVLTLSGQMPVSV